MATTKSDIRVPWVFIKEALLNPPAEWLFAGWNAQDYAESVEQSEIIRSIYQERVLDERAVSGKTKFPYIRYEVTSEPGKGVRLEIPRSYIAKKVMKATITTVHLFAEGTGSINPGNAGYQAILQCLTGIGGTPINDENGDRIGYISQSRWLDDHILNYTDKDTQENIVELGIVAEITYN